MKSFTISYKYTINMSCLIYQQYGSHNGLIFDPKDTIFSIKFV